MANRKLRHHNLPNTRINYFYSQVSLPDLNGCMKWRGSKTKHGYGLMKSEMGMLAHRFSYALHYGLFDVSLFVCHKCDNPWCVSPEHLFLGTQADNIQDCVSKGRNGRPSYLGQRNNFSKFTERQVKNIKKKLSDGVKTSELAKKYKVAYSTIYAIKTKQTWSHING